MARMNTSIESARIDGSAAAVTRRMVSQNAGTMHARDLFQLWIGIAQGGPDQQERQRRPQEALDQHHAGHRVDVISTPVEPVSVR